MDVVVDDIQGGGDVEASQVFISPNTFGHFYTRWIVYWRRDETRFLVVGVVVAIWR